MTRLRFGLRIMQSTCNNMKRSSLALLIVTCLLPISLHGAQAPNVLVFLMDDMGYGDCRAYNPDSKVAMPNLEQLAADGMRFTDAHSPSAVCAPTRYSVLTGNYPWRGRLPNGTWLFHQPSQVLPGQETIAHVMKRAGYSTAFLGKVHLGGRVFSKTTGRPVSWKFDYKDIDFTRRVEQTPGSFGFDYSYELPQGIQGPPYVAFENGMLVGEPSELKVWEPGTYGNSIITTKGFGTPDWDSSKIGPILTDKALAFLQRHITENKKNGKRRPFFMHYCSESCHTPHSPPDELGGTKIKGTTGDPHLDMLLEADVTLGLLMERLREHGELNNTLIIFTSDNGGLSRGRMSKDGPLGAHDSCASLRGSKALIWEGGHRVPLIAKWGDGTAAGSTIKPGTRSNATVGLQDLFATLSELTNQDVTPDQGRDSESFLPTLVGQTDSQDRSSLFVQANDEDNSGQRLMKMVREGDWKLITTRDLKPSHLYNLKTDLAESQDLIAQPQQQARVERMLAELKRIMQSKRSIKAFTVVNKPNPKRERGSTTDPEEPRIHVGLGETPVHMRDLFKPRLTLEMKVFSSGNGKIRRIGGQWRITGKSPLRIEFVPDGKKMWDISSYRLVGVPILNQDPGVTTVDGRLNNGNLTSWSHHAVGFGIAPFREPATLGFPFPVLAGRYKGPDVFRSIRVRNPTGIECIGVNFFQKTFVL